VWAFTLRLKSKGSTFVCGGRDPTLDLAQIGHFVWLKTTSWFAKKNRHAKSADIQRI
jgi:hypothetical protein